MNMAPRTGPVTRKKLLEAAVRSIRERGYAATKIDDVCFAAGATKGAFFHHFDSKDALALAAIDHFAERAEAMFGAARFHELTDPRERVLGYVKLRIAMLDGALPEVTCLHGTLVQEVYATHPALRVAASRHIEAGVKALAADLAAAKRRYAPRAPWTPTSVARFIEATIQGAFVMAKATGSTEAAADSLRHLRTYLETLLSPPLRKEAT
jgi:TetR/AcrR family transcriptional repressor of nem operon